MFHVLAHCNGCVKYIDKFRVIKIKCRLFKFAKKAKKQTDLTCTDCESQPDLDVNEKLTDVDGSLYQFFHKGASKDAEDCRYEG